MEEGRLVYVFCCVLEGTNDCTCVCVFGMQFALVHKTNLGKQVLVVVANVLRHSSVGQDVVDISVDFPVFCLHILTGRVGWRASQMEGVVMVNAKENRKEEEKEREVRER